MKPLLACVAFFGFAISAFAQAPSTPPISQLFAFYCNSDYSSCPDGFQPGLGPVQLSDGNFYGTTWYGDTSTDLGTVWQATLSGDVNVLYTFKPNRSGKYVNGSYPVVGFVAGTDGKLYGVTLEGGTQNSGVFYSMTTGGSLQVLYNFCSLSGCPDQAIPIVLGGDGNFYGLTAKLVFKLTPEGEWSQIYNFPSSEQGVELIAGTDGNLYGVAETLPFQDEKASVFRLTTDGVYTALHTFPKLDRVGALTQSLRGTLYGVFCCGTNTGIFQINPAGKYKVLQKTAQGTFPPSLLVKGSDGHLYGLITNGSSYPGYVFAISAKGKTIFSEEFNCTSDGCDPLSLIEANDRNFYGLTAVGGTVQQGDNPNGTIFKVATGKRR
jgi:uncharacterized repeat protein (TIGR03803 family)